MIRIAWLFVGLIAATFLGVAAYDWLPDLFASGPRTSPERLINQTLRRDDVLPFAAIPALTGVIALILVPVGLAIADSAMGLYVLHRLRALREQKTKKGVEQPMTVKEFMTLFSGTGSLERMATEYTGSLYDAEILLDGKKAKVKLSRAGAAPHFHPGTLVDRSLFLWLFRAVPIVLIGLGLSVFAYALALGYGTEVQAAASETAASRLDHYVVTALLAAAVSIAGAACVAAGTRMAGALRSLQLAGFCKEIDGLFSHGTETAHLQQVAQSAQDDSQKMTKALDKLRAEIKSAGDSASKAIQTASQDANKVLTTSVSKALDKPMTDLAASTQALAGDQNERVANLMEATLKAFIQELSAHSAEQMQQLKEQLSGATEMSQRAGENFTTATESLSKQVIDQAQTLNQSFDAALKTLTEFEKRSQKDLTNDLKTYSETLKSGVDRHSKEIAKLIDGALKQVKQTADSTLGQAGSDLQNASASLDGLQESIDNLVTLVTPILNQVIDNQENLLHAIESESASSKVIGRAAGELSAAAQASRETVERFISLAERMRETSREIRGLRGRGKDDDNRSITGQPKVPKELGDAIRDLESTTDDLPEL